MPSFQKIDRNLPIWRGLTVLLGMQVHCLQQVPSTCVEELSRVPGLTAQGAWGGAGFCRFTMSHPSGCYTLDVVGSRLESALEMAPRFLEA